MLKNIGFFLLTLCLLCSVYGCLAALIASKVRHSRLYLSAKLAGTQTTILCLIASLILWYSFYINDYSLSYVYNNSSNDLPLFYLFTAFWSSLEGSHLLWTLLLSIFSTVAHWTHSKENTAIMPFVSSALQGVLSWMFFLAVFYSNPFDILFPTPQNGTGMNELLQNPYMAFHPPSLFTGYTALAIPYAYAIGAMFCGDMTKGWIKTVRNWTLFAWIALTIGIFLGGRWAYVELGWAGYWAWDPVENSSLIPWLFCTGLIHSLILQHRFGHLKRLNLILCFLGFFFSFFGTFITRSGVISSVHSFAQSSIGPNYLIFISILFLGFVILYAFKAPQFSPPRLPLTWGFSKESALIIVQFILLSFAAIVFLGTVYPIAAETLTGVRVNVQAPYFNTFAPYVGLLFSLFMALGHLLKYGKIQNYSDLKKISLGCSFLALIPSFLFCWKGGVFLSPTIYFIVQSFGIWISFWGILCLSYQTIRDLFKDPRFKWSFSVLGVYFAHLGIYVAILGFLGNYRSVDKLVTLERGQSTQFYGYEFVFNGIQLKQIDNMQLFVAPLDVSKNQQNNLSLFPARAKYPTKNELVHEIDYASTFWHDLYITLIDFDTKLGNHATLEIHINPTVRLVWISGLLLVLGGLCLFIERFITQYKIKRQNLHRHAN